MKLNQFLSIPLFVLASGIVGLTLPAQAGTITKSKNVIVMIGDGMGWQMARAAAIYKQQREGATGNSLSDYYTEGKGSGLSFQNLNGYALATTYGTTIAPGSEEPDPLKRVFSTGNAARYGDGANLTGTNPIRPGFQFLPSFNSGYTASGGSYNPYPYSIGNLVGYDPVRGGINPWTPGSDPEYIKWSYPDSANTATTLYTGVKSYNNAIGVDIYEEALRSSLSIAADMGKATGLVTSVPVDHATPGAAAANVNRRNKYDSDYPNLDSILQQELRKYQPTVILGGGHPLSNILDPLPEGVEPLDNTYIKPSTYEELSNNPTDNIYDYTFLERGPDAAATLLETAAAIDPNNGDRLLGMYGARGQEGNLPVSSADGDYSTTGLSMFSLYSSEGLEPDMTRPLLPGETDEAFIAREINENPTLEELTQAALTVLEKDEDGFWLMVEAGDIDWSAHDNHLDNLIGTVLDFDKTVQSTIDWIEANGGWEENQLIVTADHDHYLTLNGDYPELLQTVGVEEMTYSLDPATSGHYWGSDPEDKFGWGSHSNRPVPVYYQGAQTEVLTGLVGQGYEAYGYDIPGIAGLVDQVHIFQTQQAGLEPVPEPLTLLGAGSAASFGAFFKRKMSKKQNKSKKS